MYVHFHSVQVYFHLAQVHFHSVQIDMRLLHVQMHSHHVQMRWVRFLGVKGGIIPKEYFIPSENFY